MKLKEFDWDFWLPFAAGCVTMASVIYLCYGAYIMFYS